MKVRLRSSAALRAPAFGTARACAVAAVCEIDVIVAAFGLVGMLPPGTELSKGHCAALQAATRTIEAIRKRPSVMSER